MKIQDFKAVLFVAMFVIFPTQFAFGAGECADDPDICSGPRTWFEDFNDGAPIIASDDWQARNGTSPQPVYRDGKAEFDGELQGPWVVIDSADWLFEGRSTVNIKMDANPNDTGFADQGAGWWMNVDNEQTDGGYYAIYGVLEINDNGAQQYRFGNPSAFDNWEMPHPAELIVPIPNGSGVDASIVINPGAVVGDPLPEPDENGDRVLPEGFAPSMAEVTYSITDDNSAVHEGSFMMPPIFNPPEARNQKWFTLFSFNRGWGVIDEVEVINEGRTTASTLLCDLDGDSDCDLDDIDMLYAGGGTTSEDIGTWLDQASSEDNPYKSEQADVYVMGDVNLDGDVNSADLGLLLNNFNSTDGPGFGGGDLNADSNVNSADLGLLLNNFGATSASGTAVPEPSSHLLLVLAAGLLLVMRRRRV